MTLLEKLNYYADLLIAQYRTAANARAQVMITGKQIMVDDLPAQLQTAFDLETAVGAQLDIIGKYVGVNRNIGTPISRPYFGLWNVASTFLAANYQGTWDPTTDTPTIPAAAGGNAGWWYVVIIPGTSATPIAATWLPGDIIWSDGANWARATSDNGNGLTSVTDPGINPNGVFYRVAFAAGSNTDLTDEVYRNVIKLQIILNHNDGTLATIMAYLNQFFPGKIQLVDNKDMTLSYQVASDIPLTIALFSSYLPKPMGVGIDVTIISPIPETAVGITTEGGDILTTESGDHLVTEATP